MPLSDVLRERESQYSSPAEKNLSFVGDFWDLMKRLGRVMPVESETAQALRLPAESLLMSPSDRQRMAAMTDPVPIAPASYVAGQVSGANIAGGAPGPRYGSAAQYRVPMRLKSISPSGAEYDAEYAFRNALGDPQMRGFARMGLDPETKTAHIGYLRLENPSAWGTSRGQVFGASHAPGVTPQQLQNTVGRLVEELSNAGYTRFTSEPLSYGRGRLFDRMMRKLKGEGKLPEGLTYEQDLNAYAAEGMHEGRALRNIRRQRQLDEMAREGEITSAEARQGRAQQRVGSQWAEDIDPDMADLARAEAEDTIREVIPGITARPEEFQQAVNELLEHRRLRGSTGSPVSDVLRRRRALEPEVLDPETVAQMERGAELERRTTGLGSSDRSVREQALQDLRSSTREISSQQLPSGMTVAEAISQMDAGRPLEFGDSAAFLDMLGIGVPRRRP